MESNSATSGTNKNIEIKVEITAILDMCRVCMGRRSSMNQIFTDEHRYIVDKVEFCTGLHFTSEDGLPLLICDSCLQNLSIAYNFKTTCLRSNETLRNLVKTIKVEQSENPCNVDGNDDNFSTAIDEDDNCTELLEEVLKIGNIIRKVSLDKENSSVPTTPKKKLKQPAQTKLKRKKVLRRSKMKSKSRLNMLKVDLPLRLDVEPKPLVCNMCGIKFTDTKQSVEHSKTVHKENNRFVCEICGKVLKNRASFHSHLRSHLPPEHQCDQCPYRTWHKFDMVKHQRTHSTGIKMYQCESCPASYHTSSNLRGHIRRLHEDTPKRFQCRFCDRRFHEKTKMTRHEDAHNDIKRYECDVCHSCFARRCYWKKHLQMQHGVIVPPMRPGRQKTNIVVGSPNAEKPVPKIQEKLKKVDLDKSSS